MKNLKLKTLLALILSVWLVGCTQIERKVAEIGQCIAPTANFWGQHSGQCRVIYEDGSRSTVDMPVMIGDVHIDFIPDEEGAN